MGVYLEGNVGSYAGQIFILANHKDSTHYDQSNDVLNSKPPKIDFPGILPVPFIWSF